MKDVDNDIRACDIAIRYELVTKDVKATALVARPKYVKKREKIIEETIMKVNPVKLKIYQNFTHRCLTTPIFEFCSRSR